MNKLSFPLPVEAPYKNFNLIGQAVSKIFEIVDYDDGRADAGAWVYYKLTCEPSAQVS